MRVAQVLGLLLLGGLAGCEATNSRVTTTLNEDASKVNGVPGAAMHGRVITSWIDKPSSTMSTLYGNDVAVNYARKNSDAAYPAGSQLSLVTWKQTEDPRWFGGNIPAKVVSVEQVNVDATPEKKYAYMRYDGESAKSVESVAAATPNARAAFLLGQRAAVMP
ncbi:cytochrome P460 family protein [Terriglobus saanensis]|uniref:Cytochrome P460 domain-containing protein n=1 Tax=Terriglobus saanensis (strain ATCC BAA-1853 / DSM 23119 / SP1PR4) TaxID=401053 RepID=E8V0M7_TERSS|nr:cytochrome P460 family protein [Terriglobus saanensis]ADV81090.1 hypothetical protein AciPR4_0252 [Terriglobus saanensis SP1PR4]